MNETNVTPIKTEVITLTANQINSCISKIKNAEKSGVKSTWIIAENLNKLISNNVTIDDIISEIHYNKGTISRLSRTFEMMEKSDFKAAIIERYGVNTVAELLPLKKDVENLNDALSKMDERDIPYTSKEVRALVKGYLQLEDKEVETKAESEVEITDFEKKEFINYLISEYNISERDTYILKNIIRY